MPLTISADKLQSWATDHAAAGDLPWLLRRLVRLEVGPDATVDFNTGSGIYAGGIDGYVVSAATTGQIPLGESVWEVSAEASPAPKANSDYRKRTDSTDASLRRGQTYVQVSLRRWPNRKGWSTSKSGEGKWKSVLALDAEDLSEWLQRHQALQIQLAEKIGLTSTGACPLDSWWQNWSRDGGFRWDWLLAGRGEELGRVVAALKNGTPRISIRSRSEAESLAFLYGAIKSLPEGLSEVLLARTLVLPTLESVANTGPIARGAILVTPYKLDGHYEGLLAGNAVFYCGTTGDERSIELPPINVRELAERMHRDGVDWEVAFDASKAARTSVELMRKRLGGSAVSFDVPPAVPSKFIRAAVLCNRWHLENSADLSVLAELSGVQESEVENLVRLMSKTRMPLVRHSGKACFLTDEATAWYETRDSISQAELSAFRVVISKCLASADPAFALPPEERLLAGLLPHANQESSRLLRGGLARSLAAIAEQDQPIGGYARGQAFVDEIVRDLLNDANEERWFSISHSLQFLAEAAPDVFIETLADDLARGQAASIQGLHVPGSDAFSGSSRHVELIWALERLCWNPEYLVAAAGLLCDLHDRRVGESNGNNPMRSLHEVFLAWHPSTYADVETRLRAIDVLRSSHPKASWELLVGLLPKDHENSHSTSKPGITRRQEWKRPTHGEVYHVRDQTIRRVLEDAGNDSNRLAQIATAFAGYPDQWLIPALDLLANRADEIVDEDSRYTVWDAMRLRMVQHRRYANTKWAMTTQQCDRYEAVMALYEPIEPILKLSWLFSRWVDLPMPDVGREEMARDVAAMRKEALRSVFSKSGLSGVSALAARAADPDVIGELLHRERIVSPEDERPFLSDWLGSSEQCLDAVALGYCSLAVRDKGPTWLERALKESHFSNAQKARILHCAKLGEETWRLVDASPQEVQDRYWEKMSGWIDPAWSISQVEYWISKLLQYGRVERAVDQLVSCSHGPGPFDVSGLLLRALTALKEKDSIDAENWSNCAFDLSEAFRILTDSAVDQDLVAMLEYYFYPVLKHDYRPRAFGKAMARNPQLFLEVAGLYYGGRSEGFAPSEHDRKVALNAWELLHDWSEVPGTTGGIVEEEALGKWIDEVLAGAAEDSFRTAVVSCIGEVLAHSAVGPDGNWPQEAVCAAIERYAVDPLENGLAVGRRNLNGSTIRSYDSGGILERQEETKYRQWASARTSYRRTRKILLRIANDYARDAVREDESAAMAQDLG